MLPAGGLLTGGDIKHGRRPLQANPVGLRAARRKAAALRQRVEGGRLALDAVEPLHIHIEIASPQELLQRLLDGRYGAVLTPIETHHASIRANPLFREEQRLYCGRRHPLFRGRNSVTLKHINKFGRQ